MQNQARSTSQEPSQAALSQPPETAALDPHATHVAFNLGWDLAYYGLPCETSDGEVQQGYVAGKQRFRYGARHEADRFTRKWLLLRSNAWRRGRVFSDKVTPAYLKRLDVKFCPILGIELTYGTGLETDASVDRVNNDGAYAPGNLAVMSVKANMAKGNLSFAEVIERFKTPELGPALTGTEWLRLASLMEGPCELTGEPPVPLPLIIRYVRGVRLTPAQALQYVLRAEAHNFPGLHIIRPIRKTCLVLADRKGFDGLVKRLRKRLQARVRMEDFWNHPELYGAFAGWYTKLHPKSLANIQAVLFSRSSYRRDEWDTEAWCTQSLGYYESEEAEGAAEEIEALAPAPEAPSL
jgi:hypothetical protein